MVHISDGVLAPVVWIAGFAITGAMLAWTLKKMNVEEIPKFSVTTAAVFVASLIHIKVWPTSVHLILNGLAGIILGLSAFPCIFTALVMQALLFQHGGITTLGINGVDMGLPALIAYWIFKAGNRTNFRSKEMIFGAIAGGVAVALAVFFTSIALTMTGKEFLMVATAFILVHIPVIVLEAAVVSAAAGFLARVKPEVLTGYRGRGKK